MLYSVDPLSSYERYFWVTHSCHHHIAAFSATINTASTSVVDLNVLPVKYLYHWNRLFQINESPKYTIYHTPSHTTSPSTRGSHAPPLQQRVTTRPTTLTVTVSIVGVDVMPSFQICTQFFVSSHQLSCETPILSRLIRFLLPRVRN